MLMFTHGYWGIFDNIVGIKRGSNNAPTTKKNRVLFINTARLIVLKKLGYVIIRVRSLGIIDSFDRVWRSPSLVSGHISV